jgi:hypothetical protein
MSRETPRPSFPRKIITPTSPDPNPNSKKEKQKGRSKEHAYMGFLKTRREDIMLLNAAREANVEQKRAEERASTAAHRRLRRAADARCAPSEAGCGVPRPTVV